MFFSAGDELKVSEAQRQEAVALCRQSDQRAALGCMEAFGTTDFREDLPKITVPTLVIHGDSDGIVPLEGSGARTHAAVAGSELVVVARRAARPEHQPRRRVQRGAAGVPGEVTGGVPYVWKLSTVLTPHAWPLRRSASFQTVGGCSGS